MKKLVFPLGGVVMAAGSAGPIFLTATVVSFDVGSILSATPVASSPLTLLLAGWILALPIGFMIAILPCLAGAAGMLALSRNDPFARTTFTWGMAGATLAAVAPLMLGLDLEWSALVGLTITGGACGLICRSTAEVESEEQEEEG